MSTSMLLGLFDWVGDLLKGAFNFLFGWISDFFDEFFDAFLSLIPKAIYLLYASLACILDVFQLAFRKLAGLDVYYDSQGHAITGDIVTNFIAGIFGIELNSSQGAHFDYSPLSTVFWSFVLFGVIVCVMATFVAIIKSHYSYDDKAAKGPMQYVYTALKSVVNIVAVPVIVILALFVSQALLTALDSLTSTTSGSVVDLYGEQTSLLQDVNTSKNIDSETGQGITANDKTYIYYDIFGSSAYIAYGKNPNPHEGFAWEGINLALTGATTQTFSGSLFKVAAYNANRARNGGILLGDSTIGGLSQGELFSGAKTQDELAQMIDTAFACHLHYKEAHTLNYETASEWTSTRYFTTFLARSIVSFSKFNIGAVWYYYDLWNFNFIAGFGAVIICTTLFINIILGLITRIFMSLALFIVAPPMFGLAPLDGGEMAKKWRSNFMKQILMTYGAVVGMNLFFIILPLVNQINLFNIDIVDQFMQELFIITGLLTIKSFIATISDVIGAADANKVGGDMAKDIGSTAGTAFNIVGGAVKGMGAVVKGVAKTAVGVGALVATAATGGAAGPAAAKLASAWAHRGKLGHAKLDKENAQEAFEQQQEAQQRAQRDFDAAKGTAGEAAARTRLQQANTLLDQRQNAYKAASDRVTGLEARKERRDAVVKSAKDVTIGTVKTALGIGMQTLEYAAKPFTDNDFVKSFLDKSKIKEAPDYPKETSKHTGKMLAQNDAMLKSLARIERNTKKEDKK